MGTICILLGIITIIVSIALGAYTANALLGFKTLLGASLEFVNQLSDTGLIVAVIAVFGIIGLLIGLNLIMNGLIYNKTCKISRTIKKGNY